MSAATIHHELSTALHLAANRIRRIAAPAVPAYAGCVGPQQPVVEVACADPPSRPFGPGGAVSGGAGKARNRRHTGRISRLSNAASVVGGGVIGARDFHHGLLEPRAAPVAVTLNLTRGEVLQAGPDSRSAGDGLAWPMDSPRRPHRPSQQPADGQRRQRSSIRERSNRPASMGHRSRYSACNRSLVGQNSGSVRRTPKRAASSL
jgi:hypothetical protein